MKPLFTYVIIDDNFNDATALQTQLAKFDELHLAGIFPDAQAGRAFLDKHDVDFLFLDIDMPRLNGMELLHLLPKPPVTIICTAYSEFMAQGFEQEVVDYLMKPIPFDRLVKAVQLAKRRLGRVSEEDPEVYQDYLNVKVGNGIRKFIDVADINYVRAVDHYCNVSLVDPKTGGEITVLAKQSFGSVAEHLPKKQFFQTNKSYIVALDRISEIRSSGHLMLSLPKGKLISITQANRAKLLKLSGGS
ncbi:LytR/AlgR family response regulator transcription factor [Parapedobacter koreensis]|uniref:Two component transcriptional regulator, LytTR family n=1 Tax=Parapedobacter koreensis TaxID=332977 RepID=A0A1H7U9M5_9SPHI|nr:LytTR family DNA-binding domain-containing protein [Parapedobacter koreensis]SEL93444.1 two component transcriptional regulator, LytTR family [Parapedobacter koreensis]